LEELNKDIVLIERIKQGDRASFDVLVSLYQQKGLEIAYNIVGNLEDAKDVLQEAFVKVYLNIKGFQEKAKFSTWFYRIVVN
jgi:RNA polymerase sigma-70 factor (ECF subfamily)